MKKLLYMIVPTLMVTVILASGFIYYRYDRDAHIQRMQASCLKNVHEHYAPPAGNAYSVLPANDAYTYELNAKAQCIINYPIK